MIQIADNLLINKLYTLLTKVDNPLLKYTMNIITCYYDALVVVMQDGENLQLVGDELKDNRMIVLTAVKQNGVSLRFASKKLRNIRAIVLAAVKRNGLSLAFASKRLKDSKSIAIAAINQNHRSIRYVSDRLKKNRVTEINLGEGNDWTVPIIRNVLNAKDIDLNQSERDIILDCVKRDARILDIISKDLRKNPDFMLECYMVNPLSYDYLFNRY